MSSAESTSGRTRKRPVVPSGTEFDLWMEVGETLPVKFVVSAGGEAAPSSWISENWPSFKLRQSSGGEFLYGSAVTVQTFIGAVWTADVGPSLRPGAEELDLANEYAVRAYKEAFSEIFGGGLKFRIESVRSPSHRFFRLVVMVPRKQFVDTDHLIRQETEVLKLIDEKAPDILGYFSVQYESGK